MPDAPAALIKALNNKDLSAFQAVVDTFDEKIDNYTYSGRRLLVWTARQEFGPGVALLLEKGAEPVASALQEVIFFGLSDDISAVEALIEGGVDVNQRVDGQTALGWVASINSGDDRAAAIARLLIARGANPDGDGDPPLHAAVRRPASSVVKALLEGGANPNLIDEGRSPAVQLLLTMRSAFKRDKDEDDGSAAIACEFVPESLRHLIDHGADIRIPLEDNGNSPMLFAVSCDGCPAEVVQLLCSANPDVTETIFVNKQEHIDLLTYALLTDTPHAAQLAMVQAGFPVAQRYDILGGRPYAASVAKNDHALFELLWNEGGDRFRQSILDYRDTKTGANALLIAAAGGSETVVRTLHAAGLSATETDENGKSVRSLVAALVPAMLPLIEELAKAETT